MNIIPQSPEYLRKLLEDKDAEIVCLKLQIEMLQGRLTEFEAAGDEDQSNEQAEPRDEAAGNEAEPNEEEESTDGNEAAIEYTPKVKFTYSDCVSKKNSFRIQFNLS